jgi:hypothetical protein
MVFVMDSKVFAAVAVGTLIGLLFAHESKTVQAAVPNGSRFQIQAATADESNGQGGNVPTHEVFLLDGDTGKVWQFQGLVWNTDKDGNEHVMVTPMFSPVDVVQRAPSH